MISCGFSVSVCFCCFSFVLKSFSDYKFPQIPNTSLTIIEFLPKIGWENQNMKRKKNASGFAFEKFHTSMLFCSSCSFKIFFFVLKYQIDKNENEIINSLCLFLMCLFLFLVFWEFLFFWFDVQRIESIHNSCKKSGDALKIPVFE